MAWQDMDLSTKKVCLAAFAGPIATVRDEHAMVLVSDGHSVQPVVRLFTAAGESLGSFLWESAGALVAWGWTDALQLAVLEDTGVITLRSLQGHKLREMSLGASVESQRVAAAVVWGGGAAVLTGAGQVWVTLGWGSEGSRPPTRFADPPLAGQLMGSCRLAVLQPQHTLSGAVEVLVSCGPTVWQLDEVSCVEHGLQTKNHPAPVTHLRVSPDGSFVAVYTADGRLLVMASDFSQQLSQFETRADAPPTCIEWCGSDAVVVQWAELILVVGPYGDHASWPIHDAKVVLQPEVDGVRLLSDTQHELLRKVPPALADVFRPGSTAPPTQLWDAREMLDAGQPRADKALRLLGPDLPRAVQACVEAAGHELNIPRQKALLRAAAYGRAFCGTALPPHATHNTAHRLRLLNALREPGVGLPLSMVQLEVLGIPAVVARLVALQQWLLAFRVAGSIRHAHPSLLTAASTPAAANSAAAAGAAAAALGLLHDAGALAPDLGASSPAALSLPGGSSPGALAKAAASSATLLAGGVGGTPGGLPTGGGGQGRGPLVLGLAGGTQGGANMSEALQVAVVSAWARAKISAVASGTSSNMGDAELKDMLMAKLRGCAGVRYALLAAHAQAVGRRRLALGLLEEEVCCALQVPLLLSLATGGNAGRDEGGLEGSEDPAARALRKAIESGDTDLVYLVLFHCYRQRSLQDFWQLVCSRTLARNLFIKYCRSKEPELLETLLTTTGQTVDLADLQVSRALSAWAEAHATQHATDAALAKLTSSLSDASPKYATSRDQLFSSKAVADHAALLREQAKLEQDLVSGPQHAVLALTGASLATTLQLLLRQGNMKAALALKKQFAVSDRHFCWLRIRALCEVRQWDALEAMAAERKVHPVGWEPFLEQARKHGAGQAVLSRLLARMPDSAAKAEEYAALDLPREAAEVAARLRDSALLTRIASAVGASSPAGLAVAQITERFFGTGSSGAGAAR